MSLYGPILLVRSLGLGYAGLLGAFATAVGAGPKKRVVLPLDNAGFHTRSNLEVPDGIGLVYPPPYGPGLQPAETLRPLVDEPVVDRRVPNRVSIWFGDTSSWPQDPQSTDNPYDAEAASSHGPIRLRQ